MSIESLNTCRREDNTCVWKSGTLAQLTLVDAVDQCVAEQLPSAQEYAQQDHEYTTTYWELQSKKWSEPKYRCPVCNEGGMRRDETVVLTSNPPSYRYECDKCHHIAYHHI